MAFFKKFYVKRNDNNNGDDENIQHAVEALISNFEQQDRQGVHLR